jgi:hypothetical protein
MHEARAIERGSERDAARAEVERLRVMAAPISLRDAPRDGSPVIVETRMGQVLLVHWVSHGGDGHWASQGAELTDVSLTSLCRPITPWPERKEGE